MPYKHIWMFIIFRLYLVQFTPRKQYRKPAHNIDLHKYSLSYVGYMYYTINTLKMQGIYGTYRYHYTVQQYKILHVYNLLITIIKIHINVTFK